jgi:ankyrin repeat protein
MKAYALILAASLGSAAPSAKELLDALWRGDTAAIKRVLAAGAPVDSVDESGSSALMYAALYSDVSTMRLLLDRGANPNIADKAGATALMWAISDPAKVRLLIERGANVNAVASLTGRTPLLIAAGRPGSAATVRMLLEKGADPKNRDKKGETTLTRASFSGDPEILRLLADRGLDVNERVALDKDFQLTPLMIAAFQGNTKVMEMLLARGADSSFHNSLGFSALNIGASFHDFTPFRMLIAKGGDPKERHIGGEDLLMAAAASDTTTPEVIREIAKLGLDPKARAANLHIEHGYGKESESPLDWASRHGDTPVTKLLAELTANSRVPSLPIERLAWKQKRREPPSKKLFPCCMKEAVSFFKRSGCTSCHHNMLQAVAFREARKKGISLDDEKVRRNYQQSLAWVKGSQQGLLQDIAFPGENTNSAYLLWGSKPMGTAGTPLPMLSSTSWPQRKASMEVGM